MSGGQPIIVMAPQRSGGGAGILLLFGMFFILMMIIILFWVIYKQQKQKGGGGGGGGGQQRAKVNETSLQESKSMIRAVGAGAGHDTDVLEAELEKSVQEEAAKSCMVDPLRGGQCSPNYTLEGGCCYPDASAPPNPNAAKVQLVKELAIGIGGGTLLEMLLVASITRASGTAGVKAGAAGAKVGAAAARTTAAGLKGGAAALKAAKAATATARAAAAAVRAAAAGAKAAAAAGKYAMAAAGGPIGLAVAVAMLIFDAISIALDMTDSGGYDSQTTNGTLDMLKRIIDYETAKALEIEGIEYPILFPLAVAYPEEFDASMKYALSQVEATHMLEEVLKDDVLLNAAADFIEASEEEPDVEMPQVLSDFLFQLPRRFHVERDKHIFNKLQELLGPKSYMIELYEGLSTPDRVAVTLSLRGVQEWNDNSKATWFANNDLFKQPDPPPAGEDPWAALYTDTYYVYESGPSNNPVMVPKKLPVKTALGCFYGSLVSYCEKSRKVKSTSPTINPRDLGVKFEYETGVCNFTREYCSRYGLEFKNNDCKTRPGQGVAEMIFGEVVTRGFIRAFTSPPSYAKKSEGPATVGACPPGMRDDGINCWLDPVYRGPGSPMGCKDGQEKKGQLCYSNCRDGYNSSALDCEGSCPEGSENSGFHCTQWIHSYIPDWDWKKFKLKGCRSGFKYRGTTCNEECLPDFDFRSGAVGSAFCNKTRGRYSRAGDPKPLSTCPSDKEKQGLVCYPKCSNKGDQGQYKYNGVLDWCQPEGAGGVKKGLGDRWECPEGSSSIVGICYKDCKPGESDDGLLCNPP